MLKAAHVVALVIAVVLVTRHAVDAQPRVRNRRAGRVSGNDHPLSKDQGPETLPPGQDEKTLPVGAVGASRRRTDQFDESFNLVEDELLVKFKPGVTKENRGKALDKGKAEEKQLVSAGDAVGGTGGDLVLVKVKDNNSKRLGLKAAAANISDDAAVEYVEPNYIYTTRQATPNDPRLGELWGMLAAGGGANATGAWASGYTACTDVVVGVIDTGIQVTHPDLAANIWSNLGEAAGDRRDNDNNGFVDDVNGWDFVRNDGSVYDSSKDNHGTHVAGTIGAVGNNSIGVTGVCQSGLKIVPAKFLGNAGGTTSAAIAALDYLLALKLQKGLYMVATSNSWGGGGYSKALYDAIARHNASGILFVTAAGNAGSNNDVVADYPGGYDLPNIINVGSITSSGSRSSFSNYGAATVDLFAPGSGILSTWPVSSYVSISGTSMACPHVTGACALYAAAYRSKHNAWPSAAQIKEAVMNTGVLGYAGYCVSGRRLNIGNMIRSI